MTDSAENAVASEPMRDRLKKLQDDWLVARTSIARMERDDFPPEFAASSLDIFRRFDSDPGEALYAVDVWRSEAEARAREIDPIVFPCYFSGLTRTLTAYSDRIGIFTPTLWTFWQHTTIENGWRGEDIWREWRPEVLDALSEAERDVSRLRWAIRRGSSTDDAALICRSGDDFSGSAVRAHEPVATERGISEDVSTWSPFWAQPGTKRGEALNKIEKEILTAVCQLGRPSVGEKIADRAGYRSYNSNFRSALSLLTRFGFLGNRTGSDGGYFLTRLGLDVLARMRSRIDTVPSKRLRHVS